MNKVLVCIFSAVSVYLFYRYNIIVNQEKIKTATKDIENSIVESQEKLLEDIERVKPLALDISRKRFDYLNSVTIASATIASFSLLTLQVPNLNVNKILLLLGFSILIVNSFILILLTKLSVDNENKSVSSRLDQIKDFRDVFLIEKRDPLLQKPGNQEKFEKLVNEIEKRDFITEAETVSKALEVIEFFINICIFLLFLGIMLLVSSLWY